MKKQISQSVHQTFYYYTCRLSPAKVMERTRQKKSQILFMILYVLYRIEFYDFVYGTDCGDVRGILIYWCPPW